MFQKIISIVAIIALAISSWSVTQVGKLNPGTEIVILRQSIAELQASMTGFVKEYTLGAQNAVGGKTYNLSGAGVSSSVTSISLTSFQIAGASQKLVMADFGDLGCGTIDPGSTSRQEFVSFTGVTQNSDGTATLTGVSRGLSPISPYQASTTLQKAHAGGSQFVISNSPPCFYENYANRANTTLITGDWTFTSTTTPQYNFNPIWASQGSTTLTSKGYVDDQVSAGAADATTTTDGLVRIATSYEAASSTVAGGSAAPHALTTAISSSSPYGTAQTGIWVVLTELAGKISPWTIPTTSPFQWTGRHSFLSSTTVSSSFVASASTTIAASGTTTPLVLNSVKYTFPSIEGASSTVLSTDGNGKLAWQPPVFVTTGASSTPKGYASSQTSTYYHGLGRMPQYVQIQVYTATDTGGLAEMAMSFGTATSTSAGSQQAIGVAMPTGTGTGVPLPEVSQGNIIYIKSSDGNISVKANLSALTNTTFTLTWTENLSDTTEDARKLIWTVY